MTTSLVSVIVPAYNCALYLAEALDSALDQDYAAKEVIVVDDGSVDDTPKIIERYGSRVVALRQKNSGSAAARNAGMRHARGEYFAFLDADDLWLPGKLSAQVRYLDRHASVGMVYSNWGVWHPSEGGRFETASVNGGVGAAHGGDDDLIEPRVSGWLYNELLLDCVVHTSAAMLRRSVAEAVGEFRAQFKRGQDYDYWLRVSRLTEIHKLARVLSLYRMHEESISYRVHPVNYGFEVIRTAVGQHGVVGPDGKRTPERIIARRLSDLCFRFAYHHLRYGDPGTARTSFAKSLRYFPWRPKGWLFWAEAAVRSVRP